MDSTYKSEFRELADQLSARFEARLDQRSAELRAEMKSMKAELIAWMFGFWVTTALALGGLLLTR